MSKSEFLIFWSFSICSEYMKEKYLAMNSKVIQLLMEQIYLEVNIYVIFICTIYPILLNAAI